MEVTYLILLAAISCIDGYPIYETRKNITRPISIPTITDIKFLEREVWRASSRGEINRAMKLESKLEGDILLAALNAVAQSRKDPERSKQDLRQLGVMVRRDKRTVQMLSNIVTSGTKVGLDLLFNSNSNKNQIHRLFPVNQQLKRIPRQDVINITELTENITSSASEELNNEIEPFSTTYDPFTVAPSVTTIFADVEKVTAGSDAETVTSARQHEEPEQQEENPDEGDEGGGGIGGLISSFLGSLSTPEGGVDLDAVTGLLGGLSTQNEDGTYDFTGIQDTVGSLFGGGEEEGGSNVGQFLGGLVGAVIRGSAGDAGAKGAGKITGNLLTAILPGLSAYPTPEEGAEQPAKPQQGLDSGGFFKGLITTVLGGLSGSSSGGTGMGDGSGNKVMQFKSKIFKSIFSVITHVLGGSSGKSG